MKEISIRDERYRLVATKGESQWTVYAEREGTGRRFGVECDGMTEDEAIGRLTQWLEWQDEHSAALEALQAAERAYHRAVADNAFGNHADERTPFDSQKGCLEVVEAARIKLDEARARKPDC